MSSFDVGGLDAERLPPLEVLKPQDIPSPRHTPIELLTDDVLRLIFIIVARTYRARLGSLGWIQISHVSHRWRTLVLDIPQLWAGMSFACLRESAWDSVVQRSQDLPLSVNLDNAGTHLALRHLRFASDIITRSVLLHCHLDRRRKPDWEWARELSGRTLEHLRELSIVSRTDDMQSFCDLEPLVAPILLVCTMSSNQPVIAPRLLSLTLQGAARGRVAHRLGAAIPLSRLLHHLASFPRLVDLSLEDKRIHMDDVPTYTRVGLDRLQTMSVNRAHYAEIAALLEHLQLSPSTNLYASFALPEAEQDCTALVRSLKGQLHESSRTSLQIFRSPDSSALAVRVGSSQECSEYHTRGIVLSCESRFDSSADARLAALFDVIRPLSSITSSRIASIVVDDVIALDKKIVPNKIHQATTLDRRPLSRVATAGLSSCLRRFRFVTTLHSSRLVGCCTCAHP